MSSTSGVGVGVTLVGALVVGGGVGSGVGGGVGFGVGGGFGLGVGRGVGAGVCTQFSSHVYPGRHSQALARLIGEGRGPGTLL